MRGLIGIMLIAAIVLGVVGVASIRRIVVLIRKNRWCDGMDESADKR